MAVETSDANQLAMPTVLVIVHDRSNRLTENICESKRAGFFYSRCAIFFKCISRLKMSPKKKCHYHLKNVFIVSLSASTYDWFTSYFLPVSDSSQTSKQTQNRYRLFIDVLSSLVLGKPIITPCFLIKIFALSVTKTDVTGAWAIIF